MKRKIDFTLTFKGKATLSEDGDNFSLELPSMEDIPAKVSFEE